MFHKKFTVETPALQILLDGTSLVNKMFLFIATWRNYSCTYKNDQILMDGFNQELFLSIPLWLPVLTHYEETFPL